MSPTRTRNELRYYGGGSVRKRGSIYVIRYWVNGTQREESSKQPSKAVALKMLEERVGAVRRGDILPEKKAPASWDQMVEWYKSDFEKRGKRDAQKRDEILTHLTTYFAGFVAPAISLEKIEAYKTHRLSEKAAPGTVNREVAALKRMLKITRKFGYTLAIADFEDIELMAEPEARQRAIEPHEYEALMEAAKPEPLVVGDLLTFLYLAGPRRSQAVLLTWKEVNPDTWTIDWPGRRLKSGRRQLFECSALPALVDVMQRRRADRHPGCDYVFHLNGHHLDNLLDDIWPRLCKRAGLKAGREGIIIHDFRRSAVATLKAAGLDTEAIQEWIGWRTPQMVTRYYTSRPSQVALGERVQATLKARGHLQLVTPPATAAAQRRARRAANSA